MTSDTAIHFYFIFISIKTQQEIPYYDHGNKLTYVHMWFHGAFDFKLFLLILLMLLVCVCVFFSSLVVVLSVVHNNFMQWPKGR